MTLSRFRSVSDTCIYRSHLKNSEPDRKLYLAVPSEAYAALFEEPIGEVPLQDHDISLIVFNEGKEEILQWIN